MYGIIYLTTNIKTGQMYIGQHKCTVPYPRDGYLGSGVDIKKDIAQFGAKCFVRDTLRTADTQEELDRYEIEEIAKHDAIIDDMYYNIATGGNSGGNYGSIVCDRISEGLKGHIESEETKEKISESLKGNKNRLKYSNIILFNTGEIFNTVSEAEDKYKVHHSSIVECCNGKRNSAGKIETNKKIEPMVWLFEEPEVWLI